WVTAWLGPGVGARVKASPMPQPVPASAAHLPPPVSVPLGGGVFAQAAPASARVGRLVPPSPPPPVNPFAAIQVETEPLRSAARSHGPLILAAAIGGGALVALIVLLILVLGGNGTAGPALRIKALPRELKIDVGDNTLTVDIERVRYKGPVTLRLT